MSEKPISPLRQRMIEDMTVRKLGAATQRNYIRAVKTLSEFLGRSPAMATAEDLRRFQVHQSGTGAQPSVMNNTVTALRFFFRVTLDRPEMARHLTLVRQPCKLPNVLNEEEVVRLLEHASGLKYRAALGVAYGAGLRVSEVANLKVSDIDSKRMLIRVEEGKGHAGRLAEAVQLDMAAAGWRPTAAGYLGRVTKAQILEAVREAKGEQAAQLIEDLKKADMAREAERLLEGSGWLPEPLRLRGGNASLPASTGEAGSEALPAFLVDDAEPMPRTVAAE